MSRQTDRKGTTALEVMIACVLLSLGLLPVFGMMTAGTRQSAFSEYSLFAAPRAKRIVESFLTYDYRYFAKLAESQELDIKDVIFEETSPLPSEYLAKLERDGYKETAQWERMGEGLGCLTVTIEWTFPGDGEGRGKRPHRFVLKRFVAQPDASMAMQLDLDTTAPVS